jgi:hypothetical protein
MLLDQEELPVMLELLPAERDPVGEADWVELPLRVLEGVGAAVPVPVSVALPVAVPLELWLGVALLLSEMEAEVEALSPLDKEPVGEEETVLLPLRVEEPVLLPVPVLVCEAVPVEVPLELAVGVAELLRDTLALLLLLAPDVRELVGEADTEELPLRVLEGVGAAVPVPV